jgi:hypothetical protein
MVFNPILLKGVMALVGWVERSETHQT